MTLHESCVACGRIPVDQCHVKTKKTGGTTTPWNILPMCRTHHREQHSRGWFFMWEHYPSLKDALAERGWYLVTYFGTMKMRNRRLDAVQESPVAP